MAKITMIGALDGGEVLDLHLDNGHTILFEVRVLLDDVRFAGLREDDRILYPKTDGDSVWWRDWPSISLEELVMLMIR